MSIPFFDKRFGCAADPAPLFGQCPKFGSFFFMAPLRQQSGANGADSLSHKLEQQAGTELGQAQLKLKLKLG